MGVIKPFQAFANLIPSVLAFSKTTIQIKAISAFPAVPVVKLWSSTVYKNVSQPALKGEHFMIKVQMM